MYLFVYLFSGNWSLFEIWSLLFEIFGVGAESEGFEPPWDCSRRISSPLPYQLGLALHWRYYIDFRIYVNVISLTMLIS